MKLSIETNMLLALVLFVSVITFFLAIYKSSVDQGTGELIWNTSPDTSPLPFGDVETYYVYEFIPGNETDWDKIKGAKELVMEKQAFYNLTNQTNIPEDERKDLVDIEIHYANESIIKTLQSVSTQGAAATIGGRIRGLLSDTFGVVELQPENLQFVERDMRTLGPPPWWDVIGWMGYLWSAFSPILTFNLFGKEIYTGLPPWLDTFLSTLVSALFYIFVVYLIAKFVRGI